MKLPSDPIIVALDFSSLSCALKKAEQLDPDLCKVKVGKELFTKVGPDSVVSLRKLGFDVFLDLKFHDIPNTVARACEAAADLGCWMVNLHASGGRAMMETAANVMAKLSTAPLLTAVTVLTSLNDNLLAEIGVGDGALLHTTRLAKLANSCGLDGVVCSPHEITSIRNEVNNNFLIVTPGVRPLGAALDDQARVATPSEAIKKGADYLVIGRPITEARDSHTALTEIHSNCISPI
ncbi:MAG: orotidine-5'-phosphate decarboxylase [Gammaproteobacteria bacterium]|jgi:orotidine-5'-phosphate decarboxylase